MTDKEILVWALDNSMASKEYYRKILTTTKRSQTVHMFIPPNKNIGAEVHENNDQHVIINAGNGVSIIDDIYSQIEEGTLVSIPAGTKHDFMAGENGLFLIVIYVGPLHDKDVMN